MKRIIILILFIGFLTETGNATHIVGGDTRFEQTGANTFDVHMRLFRFCSGISYPATLTARVFNNNTNASVTTISMSRGTNRTIAFGDACYTPPGLCVEVYNYSGTVTLANNTAGYYVTYSTGGRNGGLINLISGNSTWYCQIPDPALAGYNSSPKFVDYPSDGYFCVGYNKQINFSCTDADGDSLVYSLQNPYNSPQGAGGSKPIGLATYKPGYSLANIMGVTGSCTINSTTGIVTANPSQLGIFVVAVKCEEYRNGIKIGEVFRDLQYAALNCVVPTFNTDSICFGDSINFVSSVATAARTNSWDFGDGSPISNQVSPTHTFPAPGSYHVTHISYRVGSTCKDTATLPVIVLPALLPDFEADTICQGNPTNFTNRTLGYINSLSWDLGDGTTSNQSPNAVYNYTTPGTFTVNLLVKSSSFCSQNFIRSVIVKPVHRDTIYPIVCDSFVSPAGNIYRASGIYADTLSSNQVCDSIIVIDLTFGSQSFTTITQTVCDSAVSPAGQVLRVSGIYIDTLINNSGCDSIVTFNLTVNNSSTSSQTLTVCDRYTSPSGKLWTISGNYYDTVLNSMGCDSVINFVLTVNYTSIHSITAVVCDSMVSPSGKIWNASGVFIDTILNAKGCDSIMTFSLTVNYSSNSFQSLTVCDSIVSPSGKVWKASGIYLDTITNSVGCDSILTINLTVNNSTSSAQVVVVCDRYVSPSGKNWTTSGVYLDTLLNSSGCDSLITTSLTVNNTTYSSVTTTVCNSYSSPSGKSYITSGSYSDTIPNSTGCDSIISINLTVNYRSYSSQTLIVCDSFVSPSGNTITSSGLYMDTIMNSSGCDSVITLNVTVNYTSIVFQTTTVCDSLVSPSGKVWKTSGLVSDTIPNNSGCDSITVVNLTVNHTSFNTVQINACDSYTIPTSGQVVTITGNYRDTIINTTGCDSIIDYDVFVNYSSQFTITLTVCDSLVTPSGKNWKTSGNYNDTLISATGCDSIISYALTVNKCKFTTLNRSACDVLTYNGVVYTNSQTVVDTLAISTGCDSIVTCFIDVTPTPSVTLVSSSTLGYEDDQLLLQVSGALYYEWDNGSFDSIRKVKVTSVSQEFCVIGFNSPSCFADTCIQIDVKQGINIFAPNTFTPNNDGYNDCFLPIVVDVSEDNYLFQIFNKWGEEVFSTPQLNTCWEGNSSGQPSKSDIYVWKISCTDLKNQERFIKQGHIFLNR